MEDWKKNLGKIVFSTAQEEPIQNQDEQDNSEPEPNYENQKLRIWLDRKQRKGKAVTLIRGFEGSEDELNALGKDLKKHCGVGGSSKNGEIILQGDQRTKTLAFLKGKGFVQSKLAGG